MAQARQHSAVSGRLGRLFDLRQDQDTPEAIDEQVRTGVRFAGTNLWVLFFAILVASVGLNVNSTAVIIGAMLISPLMGPIVGIGYGAAINDLDLIRRALKNLVIFIGLSLLASTAYFAISPLDQPGSELLARTTPNLWDVLIAAFGGAAGMVGLTRRGFNNVVPGVAIATALMPPLCTVGFSLANARPEMALGAAYLFVINGVFIAVSTLAVAKLLRLPVLASVDEITRVRHRSVVAVALVVVIAPAAWLGWRLVQQEVFTAQARALAQAATADSAFGVVSHEIDGGARRLKLVVVGAGAERRLRDALPALARTHRLADDELAVLRVGDAMAAAVGSAHAMREIAGQVAALKAEVDALRQAAPSGKGDDEVRLLAEVRAHWPQVTAATVALGRRQGAGAASEEERLVVVELPRALHEAEAQRLQRWLQTRWPETPVRLIEDTRSPR